MGADTHPGNHVACPTVPNHAAGKLIVTYLADLQSGGEVREERQPLPIAT